LIFKSSKVVKRGRTFRGFVFPILFSSLCRLYLLYHHCTIVTFVQYSQHIILIVTTCWPKCLTQCAKGPLFAIGKIFDQRKILCREFGYRALICKRLRSPGIDSKESIPPVYVARRAGTSNRVVVPARQAWNRFLDSLKGIQIRAHTCQKTNKGDIIILIGFRPPRDTREGGATT
jgi:hypothetical protein